MTADSPQEPAANSASRPPMHIASDQQAPTRLRRVSEQRVASVVTQYALKPESVPGFMTALGPIEAALTGVDGFLDSDLRVDAHRREATAVRTFNSAESARAWAHDETAYEAAHSLAPLLEAEPVQNVLLNSVAGTEAGASTVITTRVLPGNDDRFTQWQGQVAAAQQRFPGYLGQRIQAPITGVNKDWVTIVAFDTTEHLEAWLHSSERAALVAESQPYVERYDSRPASSAFESWFTHSDSSAPPPPAWKMNAIVLLTLFPIVMLEILSLNQIVTTVIGDLSSSAVALSLGTFIGNAVSVAIVGFLLVPWASRWLQWWLVPPENSGKGRLWLGGLLVMALYAITVIAFVIVLNIWPDATSWLSP